MIAAAARAKAGGLLHDRSLAGRMLVASVLLALVVGLAFAALSATTQQLREASGARARADLLIAHINGTEKLLIDAETGERGFVITRRELFLAPVLDARRRLPAALTQLIHMTSAEPQERRLAIVIRRDALTYLTEWNARVIDSARRNVAQARALVASTGGKRRVDALRARFASLTTSANQRADTLTREAGDAADRATLFSRLGLIGAIALILIYAAYLSSVVSRPVRRVVGAADRLADGDLTVRVPSAGGGELDQLARSFNQMADSLERARAQLRTQNADLDAARSQAHGAQLRAERADQAKNEYLSRMSHELRTPLNAIIGFGQLLETEDLEPHQRDDAKHIVAAGRHLLDLINEILDISRIDAGDLAISPEPVVLADLVTDVLSLIRPLAEERQVKLQTDIDALQGLAVLADQTRLKQVLLNLLSNAIKYNRPGGTATVSQQQAGPERVRVLITDEGAGIAPDRIERLFVPFDRLGAETSDVPGTGLGLALSRKLAELMGGSITVDSELGRGTTFAVELRASEPPRDRAPTPTHDGVRSPPAISATTTIIYIEDNASNIRLVEQALAREPGVRLIPAMHAALGLELIRRHHPDLILLDLHLPDTPGEEVLRRVRADPATRDIPVVVLSADATNRQIARLLENGAHDYLTKPFDLRRFLELIHTHTR